jgi:hypothetical protein
LAIQNTGRLWWSTATGQLRASHNTAAWVFLHLHMPAGGAGGTGSTGSKDKTASMFIPAKWL